MESKYKVTFRTNEYDEYRTVLVITHNGKELEDYGDGGEPEDNSFGRDYSWIATELRRAYDLGFHDGLSVKPYQL